MAGTVAGGKAAAATNKANYGEDYYAIIGQKGGKKGRMYMQAIRIKQLDSLKLVEKKQYNGVSNLKKNYGTLL